LARTSHYALAGTIVVVLHALSATQIYGCLRSFVLSEDD